MSESSEQKKKKKRSPLTKRQLASKVTATNLWVPDKQLFDEIKKKRRKTDAELLREIVHRWAVGNRASQFAKGNQKGSRGNRTGAVVIAQTACRNGINAW